MQLFGVSTDSWATHRIGDFGTLSPENPTRDLTASPHGPILPLGKGPAGSDLVLTLRNLGLCLWSPHSWPWTRVRVCVLRASPSQSSEGASWRWWIVRLHWSLWRKHTALVTQSLSECGGPGGTPPPVQKEPPRSWLELQERRPSVFTLMGVNPFLLIIDTYQQTLQRPEFLSKEDHISLKENMLT